MSAEEKLSTISGQHPGSPGKAVGVLIGGGIGALAAYVGVRLGDTYGGVLPFAAGVIGAVLGGGVSSMFRGKADIRSRVSPEATGGSADNAAMPSQASAALVSAGSPAAEVSKPQQSSDSSSTPKRVEQEWPVETHEVQLKLDLAREYLEVGEADLAVQLVQEVFELEVATARELNSELLRETRDLSPGDEVGDRDG